MTTKYDHEVQHHDPREGFDHSEPATRKITAFVIVSVITLVVTIMALQSYFDKIWNEAVYDKVLSVPGEEVGDLRSLSNWRLNHYEYADPSKTRVRIPFERAKELFLADQDAGKTFYPGKPTEPKPEEPATPAGAAPAASPTAPGAAKQPEPGKK
ncbi:MAG TPA: hypothetical protein VGQ49_07140 [Bryobacteraceae bacterium]|jgi:hypothetical protein|nr:hypothetical protein [Bryobacteraceae bacterium]